MKKLVILSFFLYSVCALHAQNSFSVENGTQPQKYNRMIFGHFIEHFHRQVYGGIFEPGSPLSDKDGFRTDVIEALHELHPPIVRWPGGCFVSSYHWMHGVGKDRLPSYDKAWGVEDPNTFGTVEFVKWCRLIGAEPFICTNAGTGTPEEMSDWVEFCNLDMGRYALLRRESGAIEPLDVKYWSIGNENWGGHEIGAKTVDEWGRFVRESAKMMLNVDNNIKLFAAATSDEGWTLPLLKAAGDKLDYVSIHGYWDPLWHNDGIPSSYIDIMMRTLQPEDAIKSTINIIDKAGYRGKIKIAFDEWNLKAWHHPTFPGDGADKSRIKDRDKNDINAHYTMSDAVFSACFLNTCLRYCEDVEIGGFSPIINTRGALFVYPGGIVKRTTFHTISMYVNQLEENVVPVKMSSEELKNKEQSTPVLDVVVTCNGDKTRFVIAAVNKHPHKNIDFAPDFKALTGKTPKQVEAIILSGSSTEDYNDIGAENRVVPQEKTLKVKDGKLSLPPHSVAMIKINK